MNLLNVITTPPLALLMITVLCYVQQGSAVCYFPGELQGKWKTQQSTSTRGHGRGARAPLEYSTVTIEADVIKEWGVCHTRVGNNVILADRSGGSGCMRCFHLSVVSPNVMQVFTESLDTCYTNHQAALDTCPTPPRIARRLTKEVMLYKFEDTFGEHDVTQMECPISGRFTFTYRREGSSRSEAECLGGVSTVSNCPYGFGLSVQYRDCSFKFKQESLQCLGAWRGLDDQNYLAVWDPQAEREGRGHIYKCGMYDEEAGTGRIFLAFSEDSTCVNGLKSPREGHEVYVLHSETADPLPPSVLTAECRFPAWLRGHWHHTYVASNTIMFKDYVNFKTYSARCLEAMQDKERFIIYARTHCGEWSYNCLWVQRRSANVLEFQMALYPSETFDANLCDKNKFGEAWTTQAKSVLETPTSCPLVGTFGGQLPDAPGFCARLHSDCDQPDRLSFTVNDCRNSTAVYEQREYRCVGQWDENGETFVYTYRRDLGTYECFVGLVRPDGTAFIKEAGMSCSRGIQPQVFGMKLHQKAECLHQSSTARASQRNNGHVSQRPTRPPVTLRPITGTTSRPWLITGKPSSQRSASPSVVFSFSWVYMLSALLVSQALYYTTSALEFPSQFRVVT